MARLFPGRENPFGVVVVDLFQDFVGKAYALHRPMIGLLIEIEVFVFRLEYAPLGVIHVGRGIVVGSEQDPVLVLFVALGVTQVS